ncbi:MAG: thioredoxin family protein [Chloroflexi bacterium]|nr:thioredoxin family protein [Chloroflexota bacterium]
MDLIAKNNTISRVCLLVFVLLALLWLCACQSESANLDDESSYLAEIPLESVLGNGKPTLAEFGWRKCIPCKEMRPILEELDQKYKGKVNIVIVEIPFHEDLAEKYGIRFMPIQIFFDSNGEEVARHAGFLPKNEIIATFEAMGVK